MVVANAEPIDDAGRRRIERGFGCPVRETYGMVELAAGGGECERGTLHLFPEFGHWEILGDDGRLRSSGEGELVATGLLDADMPLIRYRTGDRVRLDADASPCPCGRTLPVVAAIEGRLDDILYAVDGRPVGRLDGLFKYDPPIREAQIIQHSLSDVVLRVAPAEGWSPSAGRRMTEEVEKRLGAVAVAIETVERIPRGPNGKARAAICRIPPDRRPRATEPRRFTARSA